MEYWQSEIQQMLDEVADYAEFYPNVLDMVAEAEAKATETGNLKQFHQYLRLLCTRLRNRRSQFNVTRYLRDPKGETNMFRIYNYTYDMYTWYIKRGFPEETILADTLNIDEQWLTDAERQSFMKESQRIL